MISSLLRRAPRIRISPYAWLLVPAGLGVWAQFGYNVSEHLGGEYFLIAKSLAAGQGFANPFHSQTGPTAWMAPSYSGFLYLLIKIFGSEAVIARVVSWLHVAAAAFAGWVVIRTAARTRSHASVHLAGFFYALWIAAYDFWFFRFSHDVWWNLVAVSLIVLALTRIVLKGDSRGTALGWGSIGGFTWLSSPVAGMAWTAVSVGLGAAWRRIWTLGIPVALLIAGLWVARNAAVMGRPYLIKSNLPYELYSANVENRTGLYNKWTFANHPLWATLRGSESPFETLGETAFMDRCRARFREYVRENPGDYGRKVWNRGVAVFLRHVPYHGRPDSPVPWLTAIVHPLPFVAFVGLAALAFTGRLHRTAIAGMAFYAVHVAPYVLTAFYSRYLMPLAPILVLMMFWFTDEALRRRRTA